MASDPAGDDWGRREEEEGGGQLPEFLLDPIGVWRRRWMPAVACLALGILATVAAVLLWKPVYLAQATILITSQQIPEDFVRSTVQEDSLSNLNAMIGEVLSAENLSKLIDRHKLFPKEVEGAARLDLVNRMRSQIVATPQQTESTRSRNTAAIVYAISYESGDAREAATVANSLATLFVEASANRRNTQARQATDFMRRELERDERELREHSRVTGEFRTANRGFLPDERETSLRKIEMLATQRESLSQQIAAKEDRILSISAQGSASESEVLLDELRRELARQTAVHTDDHPNVIALRDRITRLDESRNQATPLPASTQRLIDDERREVARLREQRAGIEVELAELNQRMDRTPAVAEQLVALEQKEAVLQEDYVQALRKLRDAQLAESLESAQQGGQVSVLDSADPPSRPKLSRWLVAAFGLGASVALALGIALLLELLDPVVISARQIERLSENPLLGTIPYAR